MARSIEHIETEALNRKMLEPTLDALSSPSQASVWRSWIRWAAGILFQHESQWDGIRTDLEAVIDEGRVAGFAWYARQARAYQFGHTLEILDTGLAGYSTADTEAQVVKRVSVTDGASVGYVRIKVAKLDADGLPTPLDSDEEDGLWAYLTDIRIPGNWLNLVNETPDVVAPWLKVYYDPAVGLNAVKPAVQAAITAYIQAGIAFDGRYYQTRLFDAIQAVDGVADVELDTNGVVITDYAAVVTTSPRTHIFTAGAARVSSSPSLNTTLNFVAAP